MLVYQRVSISDFRPRNPGLARAPSSPSGARRYPAPPLRRIVAQRRCAQRAELSFAVQLPVALPQERGPALPWRPWVPHGFHMGSTWVPWGVKHEQVGIS